MRLTLIALDGLTHSSDRCGRTVSVQSPLQMMARDIEYAQHGACDVGCAQHGAGESRGETFDQRTLGLGVEGIEISLPEFIHTMRTRLGYVGETDVLKQVRSALLNRSCALLSTIL